MADWKEKGEVPDSDDEEDLLDSQIHAYEEQPVSDTRNERAVGLDDHIVSGGNGYEGLQYTGSGHACKRTAAEIENSGWNGRMQISHSKREKEHSVSLPSSPDFTHGFRFPLGFLDAQDAAEDRKSYQTSLDQTHIVEDEISQSYVRITSPTSTPIPLPNAQASEKIGQEDFVQDVQCSTSDLSRTLRRGSVGGSVSLLESRDQPSAQRRSFRQRNPIQLHPYALEQEKYRRTFKARGMTPMRLHQVHDERNKRGPRSSSPDPGSQEMDFQRQESQEMDLDWNPPSSPPLPPPAQDSYKTQPRDTPSVSASDNDDDLPDLDQLLTSTPRLREGKRRQNKFSSKASFSRLQTQGSRKAATTNDVFKIPASPPPTSSPRTASAQIAGVTQLPRLSRLSEELTPSRFRQDFNLPLVTNMPTPETSAIKANGNLQTLDSDTDDPFATERDSSPSTSSSDELLQIRAVGKRIRGVLPASHLRLDQSRNKPATSRRMLRQKSAASPAKTQVRRGLAVLRQSEAAGSPLQGIHSVKDFLSDDLEDDDHGTDQNTSLMRNGDDNALEQLFAREGSAEEDDTIDHMLPSQKRQAKASNHHSVKRRRVGSTTLSRELGSGISRQPKITEHLTQNQRQMNKNKAHRVFRHVRHRNFRQSKKLSPPELSILDVVVDDSQSHLKVPRFIRIAARTARSRVGRGRQSPSKKFIRLANQDDTLDAVGVLDDWKGGKIQPKSPIVPRTSSLDLAREPFLLISSNRQGPPHCDSEVTGVRAQMSAMPRRLVVSKTKQKSMVDFVPSPEDSVKQYNLSAAEKRIKPSSLQSRFDRKQRNASGARPAQLEVTEADYSQQNPTSAFRSTKKTLDAIYRTRRSKGGHKDLQLGRFLANEKAPRNSLGGSANMSEANTKFSVEQPVSRRKKLPPERIDIGAARYRQPSEPLFLEFQSLELASELISEANKLQGLGKFGTRYSLNFDIFPLQSGIYFHESTFIGSGRLSKAVNGKVQTGLQGQHSCLKIGQKELRWGAWDQTVSSELGVCFDWVFDELTSAYPRAITTSADSTHVFTYVFDYIQDYLGLTGSDGQLDFLTRLTEVLKDFASHVKGRLSAVRQTSFEGIRVMSRCCMICLQILHIARTRPDTLLSFDLEDVLKDIACVCVDLLLLQGVNGIRKLYDDLQYLSFRERGIRNDQCVVESWVIIFQVLGAARIRRASFWDVLGSGLLESEVPTTNDAQRMERVWYSMFSLLPLCGFDELGIVRSGQRRESQSYDWSLPQQLLKRVFALYVADPRQPPGFNDYCRALVHRCHYLMTTWCWWKCSSIVGTIFDFFATQKLAHLRNEEVYDSPRFLRELDKSPSLEVDSEDRCFHIFLKLVGLTIKQMEKTGDVKDIRNLSARLLPNHDRQYPKEEVVHQRDLASLRNHHDLLCTLYWAAPAEHKSIPFRIQELVIADHSHKEACLINLRAWENLTRFVVTLSKPDLFKSFTLWQNEFATKLRHQYIGIDLDVREQAELIEKKGKPPISPTLLTQTILGNKRSTVDTLCTMLKIMDHTVKAATSSQLAIQAFNPDLLRIVGQLDTWSDSDLSERILRACVDSVRHYTQQIDCLEPIADRDVSNHATEPESQDSLDFPLLDRLEMIYRLQSDPLHLLRSAMKRGLQDELKSHSDPSLLADLVTCWSSVVVKLTESSMKLGDFILKGPNAVFQERNKLSTSSIYWPLFLANLVEHKGLDELQVPGFDIGLQWLLAISKPQSSPIKTNFVAMLTAQMRSKGHYLLIAPQFPPSSSNNTSCSPVTVPNHILIKRAVHIMRTILRSESALDLVVDIKSHREALSKFSIMLKEVMDTMKHILEHMILGSNEHMEYVRFVQVIISIIRSYGSDIRPPLDFFSQSSTYYWPEDADPSLFAAGIVSYSLRLADSPRKTAPSLFYYLFNGWRRELLQGNIAKHMSHVKKGLRQLEFMVFLMTEFMPAALHVGFHSPGGWVLCATYLPLLSSRVSRILKNNASEAPGIFENLINILRIIVNGISVRYTGIGVNGVDLTYQAIVKVSCQFWLSVMNPIRHFAKVHSQLNMVEEVTAPLTRFLFKACQPYEGGFGTGLWEIERLEVRNGEQIEYFVNIMIRDIDSHWEIDEDTLGALIGGTGAQEGHKTWVDFRRAIGAPLPLLQMLDLALPFLEPFGEMDVPSILRPRDRLLQDIYL